MEHLGLRLTRKKTPQTPRSKTADYLVEKPKVTGFTLLLHRPKDTRTLKESSLSVRETNHLIYM